MNSHGHELRCSHSGRALVRVGYKIIEQFCLADLPLRLVRSVHGLTTACLVDQFAADDKTAVRLPTRREVQLCGSAYGGGA